jgi:hypothetical protein
MRMTAPLVLFLLFLLVVAVACLFFPKAIQSVATRAVQMGVTSRSQALVAFVSSKQYLVVVRAVGLIALVAAVFLSTASFRGS